MIKNLMHSLSVNKTKALAFSGVVIAMYAAIMFITQSFAFLAYQIRIATSLYALSYFFPFLIIPLGLANSLSNILGGLGIWDIAGGFIVGIVTSGAVYLVRKYRLPMLLVIPIIILGPGCIVPLWLSPILGIPYSALLTSIGIGQIIPAILGYVMLKALERLGINAHENHGEKDTAE
jgi:uncharacterized membrane protein